MMKVTAILLLSIYSISTMGLSLKSFYCCGNLESVTVAAPRYEKKQCANGDDKSDCCKTKYQLLKVNDNHVAGDVISVPVLYNIDLHLFLSSSQFINYSSREIFSTNQGNGPPLLHSVPGYIFNCVFRV